MEGRISREELINSSAKPQNEESPPKASGYSGYARRSYGGGRGYRKRGAYGRRRSPSSEDGDMLAVQLFVCGALLLFVLFISVVDTSATAALSEKLNTAFSKNTTFDELKGGALLVRDTLKQGAGTVVEIFGGEPAESGGASLSEDTGENAPGIADGHLKEREGYIQNAGGADVSIDSEALREIYENTGEAPKN